MFVTYTTSILEVLHKRKHVIHKNLFKANLVYNAISGDHTRHFRKHYSLLTSLVVL